MKVLKGKSGITVLFRPMKSGLVDFRYYVKCGATDESPAEWGYCHALEHMVFAGTEKRTWRQISRDWEKLGTYYNAHTYHDKTTYEATGLKKHWQQSYEILADMFYNCQFPEERWEDIEKGAVISEIQGCMDNQGDVLEEELYGRALGERYHSIVGGVEVIRSSKISDLTRFYDEYYHGDNIFLLVTGDLTEKQLMKAVNKYDRLRPGATKRKKFRTGFNYGSFKLIDSSAEQVHIHTLMPVVMPKLYRTRIALELGVDCMSQYLFEELREQQGLVYGASASLYWDLPGNLFLLTKTATDMARLEKTQRALKEALNSFPLNGLSAERIQNMKTAEVYSSVNAGEDIDTSATWLWDAWEEEITDEDPYKMHLHTVERLTVESIRSTTRLGIIGRKKLGKLVGS